MPTRRTRNIGILGGVFDPVHCGHLSIAALAKYSFDLDHVVFIPSGAPPHKSSVSAPPEDRLHMLRLALADMDGCEVWEGELGRDGYSYTIDTLKELSAVYKSSKFYFIIGTDNLADILKWRSYKEIIKRVTLCTANRPGYDPVVPDALASADIERFPGPEWGLSSTILREYLKMGLSCRWLIPDAVLEYIKDKGLYGYTHR